MAKTKLLKTLPIDDPQRIDGEKQRRKYIKSNGGLCKGLTAEDAEKAQQACAEYGLSAGDGWDKEIVLGHNYVQG